MPVLPLCHVVPPCPSCASTYPHGALVCLHVCSFAPSERLREELQRTKTTLGQEQVARAEATLHRVGPRRDRIMWLALGCEERITFHMWCMWHAVVGSQVMKAVESELDQLHIQWAEESRADHAHIAQLQHELAHWRGSGGPQHHALARSGGEGVQPYVQRHCSQGGLAPAMGALPQGGLAPCPPASQCLALMPPGGAPARGALVERAPEPVIVTPLRGEPEPSLERSGVAPGAQHRQSTLGGQCRFENRGQPAREQTRAGEQPVPLGARPSSAPGLVRGVRGARHRGSPPQTCELRQERHDKLRQERHAGDAAGMGQHLRHGDTSGMRHPEPSKASTSRVVLREPVSEQVSTRLATSPVVASPWKAPMSHQGGGRQPGGNYSNEPEPHAPRATTDCNLEPHAPQRGDRDRRGAGHMAGPTGPTAAGVGHKTGTARHDTVHPGQVHPTLWTEQGEEEVHF